MSTKGSPMTELDAARERLEKAAQRWSLNGPTARVSIKLGDLRAALTAWNTRPSVVPEGFKLVPVEPTEAMLDAGADEVWPGGSKPAYAFADARRVYGAMLLASQEG